MDAFRLWMLIVSALSFFGSWLGFFSPHHVRTKQFNRAVLSVSDLTSRLFGTWTLVAGWIRLLYVLFPRSIPVQLAVMGTFAVVIAFYLNEIVTHRSVSFRAGLSPLITAGFSLYVLATRHGPQATYALMQAIAEFLADLRSGSIVFK